MFRFLVLLFLPIAAFAIEISDMTSVVASQKKDVTIYAKNTEQKATLLSISVVQVDSPYEDAKQLEGGEAMVQFTPARALLSAGQTQGVKFIYSGPSDGVERYYKVLWRSSYVAMADKEASEEKKANVDFVTGVKTNLVIFPRQQNFAYSYGVGKVENKGNVAFQAIAYGPCKVKLDRDVCKERYWIAPGHSINFSTIDVSKGEDRLMVQRDGKFIPADRDA